MGSNTTWYYEHNRERQGPVSSEEILVLRQRGMISDTTLVWREGLQSWVAFSSSELAAISPPAMLPPSSGTASVNLGQNPSFSGSSPTGQASYGAPPAAPITAPFVPKRARLRQDAPFSVRSAYGRAWQALRGNFWPIIGCFLLSYLILSAVSMLYVTPFFLTYPVIAGLFWYLLTHLRGGQATLEMLFEGFRRQLGSLIKLNLIISVAALAIILPIALIGVLAIFGLNSGFNLEALGQNPEMVAQNPAVMWLIFGGMMLLYFVLALVMIPLGITGIFSTLLILDCEISVGSALSLAWQGVKLHWFRYFLFVVVGYVLLFVGLLAFFVGSIIGGVLMVIALAIAYQDTYELE